MAERDPLDHLLAAERPEHPDPQFAARLIDSLLSDLDTEAHPGAAPVEVVKLQEDTSMNTQSPRWRWTLIGAAATVIIVIIGLIAFVSDDDDSDIVDTPPPTTPTTTPTTSEPEVDERADDPLPQARLRMSPITEAGISRTLVNVRAFPETTGSSIRTINDSEFAFMSDNLPGERADSSFDCTVGPVLEAVPDTTGLVVVATSELDDTEIILIAVGNSARERTGVVVDATTCDVLIVESAPTG